MIDIHDPIEIQVGEVVTDMYDNIVYVIKEHNKKGLSILHSINDNSDTTWNSYNNNRFYINKVEPSLISLL